MQPRGSVGLALLGFFWALAGQPRAADGGLGAASPDAGAPPSDAGSVAAPRGLFRPKPIDKDNYGESFTFLADLNDGTYVWAQFSLTNIGPGSDHGICRASVTAPNGSVWKADRRVKPGDDDDEWRYDDKSDTLWIARCSARDGAFPEMTAEFDEGSLTLRFAGALRPVQPDGSEFRIDGSVYRVKVLQPFAPVKATLRLGKSGSRTVEGGGYVDHAYTAAKPSKVARHWVRFRALRDTPTVLLGREAQDASFGPTFRWSESGVQYFRSFTLQRDGKDSGTTWSIRLGQPDGGTIKTSRFLSRRSFIQDLGFLGRIVKPFVGSPVTYTHRALYERPGQPPVQGILEVSVEEG